MKIPFCNSWCRTWLAKKQIRWCIVSFVCLLCGTYLVGRHFSFLTFLILAFAIILTGRTAGGRPDRDRGEKKTSAGLEGKAPPNTPTGGYWPQKKKPPGAVFYCGEEEKTPICRSASS